MPIKTITVALAALAAAGATQAYAQPYGPSSPGYDQAPSVNELVVQAPYAPPGTAIRAEPVSYADLDLNSEAGAYTLLTRISAASKRVCSPEPSTLKELADTADYQRCRRDAMDGAVYRLNAPSVNDLYDGPQDVAYGYGDDGY